ncbi:MAG: helix-turn-helix domain-containing protein [Ktedonobacterales bacterium]|nr:helix-turn-helix domain-containing protein [Ktedonobacterales bacterium]
MVQTRRGRKEIELDAVPPTTHLVGEAVRKWRRQRGLTVTELAIRAGFGRSGRSYISKIEHGAIRQIGEPHLLAILTALQIQRSDLSLLPMSNTATNHPALDATPFSDPWTMIDQAREGTPSSVPIQRTGHEAVLEQVARNSAQRVMHRDINASNEMMIDIVLQDIEQYCQRYMQQLLQQVLRPLLQTLMREASSSHSLDEQTLAQVRQLLSQNLGQETGIPQSNDQLLSHEPPAQVAPH